MAWYRAGTIAVANGSTAVVGTGTNFIDTAAGVSAGDSLIVGTGTSLRIYEIASVNSATSLTLTTAASLAVAAGSAYQIQTSVSMSNGSLAKKVSAAYDRILQSIANWVTIMTGSGTVTIQPYGSDQQYSGLAWPTLTSLAQNALPINVTPLTTVNTYLANGIFSSASGATGAPVSNAVGQLTNIRYGATSVLQEWTSLASPSRQFFRYGTVSGTTVSWGAWAEQYGQGSLVPAENGGTGQATASAGWKALLDGRTAATARNDLGLGNAATRTVTEGRGYPNDVVLGRGAFGLGGAISPDGNSDGRYNEYSGFYAGPGASGTNYFDAYAPMLVMSRYQGVLGMMQISPGSGKAAVRGRNGDVFTNWLEIYTTGNTTKASDGTLKAASPVARIVKSQEATTRADVVEAGFSWCGCGTSNEEAEGISISRLDTGVYVLAGSAGLASEGWQLLPPRDPQGSGDLGIVEAEQTESGGLTIRLYKRRYKLSDDGDILVVKGDLIDVPSNSWIDVRLNMPKDSVYNASQTEVK